MIGAWVAGGSIAVRDDLENPRPREGDALIRVHVAGICGTDLGLLRGYASFEGIPGHEFVGTVEEGPSSWVGARVVCEINVTCDSYEAAEARCPQCSAGRSAHCTRREVLGIRGRDGAFAEWVTAPIRNLHRVPDDVSDETAVFVEPLAAALRIQEQLGLDGRERVLVVGPGRLGQLVARSLVAKVSCLEVTGRSDGARARSKAAGIATRNFDEVRGGAYDVVVECTGHPDGFEVARASTRAGGTIVVKSTYNNVLPVDISSLVVDEIHLVGSRCGPFPAALAALEEGRIQVLDLITDRFALSDARAAFKRAGTSGAGKVLLSPTA